VLIVAVQLAAAALLLAGAASTAATLPRVALLVCAVYLTPVSLWLFVRHGRLARVLLAGLIGLGAIVVGLASSVPRAALTAVDIGDVLGIVSTLAGVVLAVMAFVIALHGRRLVVKVAVTIAGCFVIAQWLIAPAINVGLITNAPRPNVASAFTLGIPGAQDVAFPASDGVRLAGWYAPGRTGAAVILLHGSHGTRADTLAQLRMLVGGGYDVLAYDARGDGQSAGQTNALGWLGASDIAGAIAFLDGQPGVDPGRVAALGLSMGAEAALRAAAERLPLAAVVADGAGASTLGDDELSPHAFTPVFTSVTWLTMRGVELVSGEREPAPLESIVGRIRVPVLLIASNASGERAIDAAYRARIGARASLWYLSDAKHTAGLSAHPRAYAARVLAFLAAALRRHPSRGG
jgi:pimeloyl-ACP methyl ester carboxylesterase